MKVPFETKVAPKGSYIVLARRSSSTALYGPTMSETSYRVVQVASNNVRGFVTKYAIGKTIYKVDVKRETVLLISRDQEVAATLVGTWFDSLDEMKAALRPAVTA